MSRTVEASRRDQRQIGGYFVRFARALITGCDLARSPRARARDYPAGFRRSRREGVAGCTLTGMKSPNRGDFPRLRVQVPLGHKPPRISRFPYRLNARPCDLPLRGDFAGLHS
jgi:hypothetical protein